MGRTTGKGGGNVSTKRKVPVEMKPGRPGCGGSGLRYRSDNVCAMVEHVQRPLYMNGEGVGKKKEGTRLSGKPKLDLKNLKIVILI